MVTSTASTASQRTVTSTCPVISCYEAVCQSTRRMSAATQTGSVLRSWKIWKLQKLLKLKLPLRPLTNVSYRRQRDRVKWYHQGITLTWQRGPALYSLMEAAKETKTISNQKKSARAHVLSSWQQHQNRPMRQKSLNVNKKNLLGNVEDSTKSIISTLIPANVMSLSTLDVVVMTTDLTVWTSAT